MNDTGKILVISGSLNPGSNSRILAWAADDELKKLGAATTRLDLRDYKIPLCDGATSYEHHELPGVSEIIAGAQGIIIGVPVYNFGASAAVKNLLEMTGNAWKEKIVGFVCAAGGKAGYMSVMGLANSLMLDFRCLIVPRFVYATRDDFDGERIGSEAIRDRVKDLAERTHRLTSALK